MTSMGVGKVAIRILIDRVHTAQHIAALPHHRVTNAMMPESSTGKKNALAKLGRFLRPGSSRSTSLSSAPNLATPPTTHQDPQWYGLEDSGKPAWKAMEAALRLLEKSADAFPPLKSAIGGLVACLDLAKNVIGNQEEYVKLTEEFKEMADTLAPWASKLVEADAGGSIALILKSIEEELAVIKCQLERGKFKRAVEATDDQSTIVRQYRKIDSLFRRLLRDVTLRTHIEIGKLRKATEETLLRVLTPVDDARYNSWYSTAVKRRGCTASTREQILDDLRAWVKDPASSKVFWMNGMAGTGKTTILYSFCEWLEENKRLAGNFFCNRASTSCRDLNNIVRSIAYQLAHYSPAFRSQLCKILEEKQNPHMLNIKEQFKWVVETPLQNSKDAIPDGAVIVIDALDECDNILATALFLKVLLQYSTRLPIKFLVASRPEPVIAEKMQAPGFSHSMLRLHDIEQSLVEADIRQYLQEAFCTMSPIPSSNVIDQLTSRSGKLFIYAATVARYVNPEGVKVNSQKRLKMILGISSSSSNLQYQELDNLYAGILLSAFDKGNIEEEELEIAAQVLRTVICAIEPMATSTISTILALEQEDVSSSLSRLESVLHIQEGPSGLVSILHASFPDFLCDKARSRDFYCNVAEHSTRLAHSCFNVMCQELHFNICDLESSYDFDEDVPDLEQKIRANISAALLYACKYWSRHLAHCDLTSSIHYRLIEFLKFRFLFWMEVLNLTKSISMGSQMLSSTLAWFIRKAPELMFKETEKELYDAELFVKTFSLGACKKSTPHIYISALPFCYKSSSVYQNYWSKTNGLIVANGTSLIHRANVPMGVWKTGSSLNTVAFSTDRSKFASGNADGILDILDIQSGETVFHPFLEDRASIVAVVFSPDNSKIAAGSEDGTVRIWDLSTGNLIAGPLKTKTGYGPSQVAFSWNSKKLALCSSTTLEVCDSSSGEGLTSGQFETSSEWHRSSGLNIAFTPDDSKILFLNSDGMVYVLDARSVSIISEPFNIIKEETIVWSTSISPDGTMLAVGYDMYIDIWGIQERAIIRGPFIGHFDGVAALAFLHDGKKLISGQDTTIRIWDVETGNVVAGPLVGHTHTIHSLALSSSGTEFISGSYDGSVRLWGIYTHDVNIAPQRPVVTTFFYGIAWSPNGITIASRQYDGTVAVWDAENGKAVIEPFDHLLGPVSSITFSPDCSRISAGMVDGRVISHDLRTGETTGKPFQGHSNAVSVLMYSLDGSMIASGSAGSTLIIWDCSTGEMIGKPFGHGIWTTSVAFTPNGDRLVSGGHDKLIHIWDIQTGQSILGPIEGHEKSVYSVACSPVQPLCVSGSEDGTIRVWSMISGKTITGPVDAHCGTPVNSVAYTRDGTKIISGFADGTICILDAETGNILASIDAHTDVVTSVVVPQDGTSLFISASYDRSVRVWQLDILTSPELLRNAPTIWMPEDVTTPTISNTAKYEKDGWVVLKDMHLFWTPQAFRESLCYPFNSVVIGPHGTTSIDYSPSKLFIGKTWSKCWIYGPTVKTSITQ
ncbi:hypothetical protein D9613_007954 [Agrocybe pediades]|uniref:Nephrocystin 3-like N-terminal domain-containing protein n=1 Tax=Agrocybe pediades TaxID=84607 RepID=A0A8H4QMJ3_9AGAR|nr:hypothetical protein D9613_007954 [Agrocybe pediades]